MPDLYGKSDEGRWRASEKAGTAVEEMQELELDQDGDWHTKERLHRDLMQFVSLLPKGSL